MINPEGFDTTIVALLSLTVIVASAAVLFSFREIKAKKEFLKQKQELTERLFELSVLKSLSEAIGYSLNIEKVIEGIVQAAQTLLDLSAISYVYINKEAIHVMTYIKKDVSKQFLEEVRGICLNAVFEISPDKRHMKTIESVQGVTVGSQISKPKSYFNIPFVVGNQLIGFINVSSAETVYHERDMNIVSSITKQATNAVDRLKSITETEKGKLNSLLLSIPTGAVMFSIENDIMELSAINTSAKDYLHLTGEVDTFKVVSSFPHDFNLPQQIKKVLESKEKIMLENIVIHEKFFKVFLNPVFLYGTGKIIGVSITLEDMTIEKQIQQIRETFTHMVVHELRAPLTSMKGASELVKSGKLKKEEEFKMLQLIHDSTETMLGQIADLLDASKIEAGKFEIMKDIGDLNGLISERVEVFKTVAASKNVVLDAKLDTTIPQFAFDRERIAQVLNNLISNSLKYTHASGKVQVSSKLETNVIKISVSDNGIGIPQAKQALLFKKYSQAGQGGFKSGTTGLGLYIAKSIVESHGGKINLQSKEGEGTTVSFTIPASDTMRAGFQGDQMHAMHGVYN